MAVFRSFRLDAYFLTIIAGIINTERVAYDFSNVRLYQLGSVAILKESMIYAWLRLAIEA